MVEEQVVHLPELPLRARRLGRLGGQLRARMDVGQRQVAEHEAEVVAEVGEELAQHRLRAPAVRALEVPVFDERDRRVLRPADVVALGVDRQGKVDDRLRPAEREAGPRLGRQPFQRREVEGADRGRADRRTEDAELRLGQLLALEGERGDEQRDGESDPGDGAAAEQVRPPDR